jgi:glucokinase
MERALRSEMIDVLAEVPLRPAELGEHAALVGAARVAWTRLEAAGEEPA